MEKSNDYLKCFTCPEEDHEGQFCRCESRNIRIAKEKRFHGESPWSIQTSKKICELERRINLLEDENLKDIGL